jgi:hypothetical protein
MAVLDTSRAGLEARARAVIGCSLSRSRMARLLSKSQGTRLVEIVARNASLGPPAVRRRFSTAWRRRRLRWTNSSSWRRRIRSPTTSTASPFARLDSDWVGSPIIRPDDRLRNGAIGLNPWAVASDSTQRPASATRSRVPGPRRRVR